jgi:anti-sigma B factor antagonist
MNRRLNTMLCPAARCTEQAAGAVVVRLRGELDSYTAPALRDRLEEHLASYPDVVLVDMTELEFLGVAGLTVLLDAQAAAEARHIQLVVTGTPQPVVARMLSLVGWSPVCEDA